MSYYFTIGGAVHQSRVPAPRSERVVAYFVAAWKGYLARRRLKATVWTLQGLDDRTLHDIGLDRSEIESAVLARRGEHRRQMIDIGGAGRHG